MANQLLSNNDKDFIVWIDSVKSKSSYSNSHNDKYNLYLYLLYR